MYTKYPDGSVSCSACIRAIDLIKIANQMFQDNMRYAQIRVTFKEYCHDYDGLVRISAISSPDSDDVTIYPDLKGMLTIEIDDEDN